MNDNLKSIQSQRADNDYTANKPLKKDGKIPVIPKSKQDTLCIMQLSPNMKD